MKNKDIFESGQYYHVYNQGNNGEKIFKCKENYSYFMRKLHENMNEVWELHSWCLMPNHFHLLVRIKDFKDKSIEEIHRLIYSNFSHFTNGYAKAINKAFGRRGSLFQKGFKHKHIRDEQYLKQVIIYI